MVADSGRETLRKERPMKKRVFLILFLMVLVPLAGVAVARSTPAAEVQSCATVAAQPDASGHKLTPASTCGPNFCTQAQKTQCAQSCRRHPFVGLECCESTCTSFCNCGSVPTGGC